MKIPFDIKYRPQIESGEYKVQTRDGSPARIICWDRHATEPYDGCILVALVTLRNKSESAYYYYSDGHLWDKSNGEGDSHLDLFIITPEPELTEFEIELHEIVSQVLSDKRIPDCREQFEKEAASALLIKAKKEICKGCTVSIDGYIRGRDDERKAQDKSKTFYTEDHSYIFHKLGESEDERISKRIRLCLDECVHSDIIRDDERDECLAYLEKQKENPKSAISIPSDCASDAKCENSWHKVADSLPDNPREVLCKDEAGNFFIGRYYVGEGWEISNYDDEDKPHDLNPPVVKWIDFPSEKQKEIPTDDEMLRTLRCEYEKGVVDTIAKYEQKSQMPMPEDTVLFNKGVAEGRRLERQDITEVETGLVDAVEKYVVQGCSRSTLLAKKDKLKRLIEE